MGYYVSDIDLSDLDESENYAPISVLEESAYFWTFEEDPISETTSTSDRQTDISTRRKKYTKNRAPTPYKPQTLFFPRHCPGRSQNF